MVMATNKLHPIYAALDNHQYNRAIKLCLAQSSNNVLCQALLAHSYAKYGQRYKALLTIQRLLPGTNINDIFFPEFHEEVKNVYILESPDEIATIGPTVAVTPAKKIIKKGKKKVSNVLQSGQIAANNQSSSPHPSKSILPEGWDLIDQLDRPSFPWENWDRLPPPSVENGKDVESSILDPTFLSTLSTTMVNHLKLPLTAYQIYCWAASASHNSNDTDEEIFLRKAYVTGLVVLLSPQYRPIALSLLSNLQNIALQLARLNSSVKNSPVHMWAAQTALWQIEFAKGTVPLNEKNEARINMLPRLAESLAQKFVHNVSNAEEIEITHDFDISLVATESFLLYVRTLDIQTNVKFEEKLEAIQAKLNKFESSRGERPQDLLFPPRQCLLQMKVDVLRKQGNFNDARNTLEVLIGSYPDDWMYWKSYLECAISETGDAYAGGKLTNELVDSVIAKNTHNTNEIPSRVVRWVEIESSSKKFHVSSSERVHLDSSFLDAFVDSLKRYGDDFAKRSAATFSDLCPYIDMCLETGSSVHTLSLLEWSKSLRIKPVSEELKERCAELKVYIFSVQINHKILSKHRELWQDHLPPWEELIEVCNSFRSFEIADGTDREQRENRPADELVILAVHQLRCVDVTETNKIRGIYFLDDAIQYSPYNPNLKIAAILAYAHFNAASMCWDLYNALRIKHIQHESCSYLILNILHSGGLYTEILQVCQDILGLQRTSVREAGEFTGRAMENGSISKADEFISFHRNRMQRSLVTLQAKGLVLDCAPMFSQEQAQNAVGSLHGIVGTDSDLPRVKQMISEAHNPSGAFSLLELCGSVKENVLEFADNRDFSILSLEILQNTEFDTPEQIVSNSIRRSWLHNLILRAALCVDATRGPKKGKAVKPSPELEKRCKSLLRWVSEADAERHGLIEQPGYDWLLDSMKKICESLVSICSGMTSNEEISFEGLEERENAGLLLMQNASESIRNAKENLSQKDALSISRSCKLLSDFLVPIFALFQMNAKIADLFGWGKRRRKTKKYSEAVAGFACEFSSLVDALLACSCTLTLDNLTRSLKFTPCELIGQSAFESTVSNVFKSQQVTKQRITEALVGIKEVLTSFDIEF